MTPRGGFDVQGHRGARGLRPENTLAGVEYALNCGVSSIEVDLHLSRDGVPMVFHDAQVSDRLCSCAPADSPAVSRLTRDELRRFRVDRNPDPRRFPDQQASAGLHARQFAEDRGIDPLGIPTLGELLAFVTAYGAAADRTSDQRRRARRVHIDLELKRVPFWPEFIGDNYDGTAAGELERRVIADVERARMVDRAGIRSFDHRSVNFAGALCPGLCRAVIVAHTAPARPADLLAAAGAAVYCPDYRFVDAWTVRQVHDAGKQIIPWTVNQVDEWERLAAWGVDGITTDFPDHLIAWLRLHGIAVLGDEGA